MGGRGKPESGHVGCYHAVAASCRGATMAPAAHAVHAALSFSLCFSLSLRWWALGGGWFRVGYTRRESKSLAGPAWGEGGGEMGWAHAGLSPVRHYQHEQA
jgi:hypothetical protein